MTRQEEGHREEAAPAAFAGLGADLFGYFPEQRRISFFKKCPRALRFLRPPRPQLLPGLSELELATRSLGARGRCKSQILDSRE